MANRKTFLDWTTIGIFGTDYLADADSIHVDVENKTAEGKGGAETDDWPVLVGRATTVTMNIQIPSVAGSALIGTAWSANPTGTISFATGAGKTYAGTAVLTALGHHVEREGIQLTPITLKMRGAVSVT